MGTGRTNTKLNGVKGHKSHMNGLQNNCFNLIYLPENALDLQRTIGSLIHVLTTEGKLPYKIVVDPEGYERIANAVRHTDKRVWRIYGTFMDLEVVVTDKIDTKVAYVLWKTDESQPWT